MTLIDIENALLSYKKGSLLQAYTTPVSSGFLTGEDLEGIIEFLLPVQLSANYCVVVMDSLVSKKFILCLKTSECVFCARTLKSPPSLFSALTES